MLGETISHYKIIEKLGQGGMGEVFTAHDTKLGRDVALKFLSESLCSQPEARQRFEREARAIAALNHPHICTIFEIGDHEGRPFLAMEYLEGNSLDDVIAAGPLPVERLQSLAFQLCDALQEAHSKGILHRDIKPANVFLDHKGTAKLLDFGLAKSMSEPVHGAGAAETVVATPGPESAATMDAGLTQVGAMLGTILYMSPEQFRGEELDARSDLYSLGRVLYETATGSVGFEGKALGTVAEAILTETTPLASTVRPDIPPSLDLVIDRLLQKAPENRFSSASEVREAMIVGGRGGSATGSSGPSGEGIRTLGQLRSETWLIPLLSSSIPLAMYIGSVVDGGEDEWVNASPLLMFAFLGWAGAWWLHRRSSRRTQLSSTSRTLKLRRLQDQDADRGWMWGYLLPGISAVILTITTAYSVWRMTRGGGPSALDFAFRAGLTVLFWIPVLRAHAWHKDPPSRRNREIELEISFPRVLSRISDAIDELEARVIGMDLDRGWISFTTSAAVWVGMGERVTIRIEESRPGFHVVALESVSIAPWSRLGDGKNKANLNKIVEIMLR